MDLLRETCTVTGKVITGYGLDEFQKNWEEHIKTLKEKGLIFDADNKIKKKERESREKERTQKRKENRNKEK